MSHPDPKPPCPACGSGPVVRNGLGKLGQQSYRCTGCERRVVPHPAKGPIPEATPALVACQIGERVSLRGIARVTGVSRAWLHAFVKARYRDDARWRIEPQTPTSAENKGAVVIEADELWSFVGAKWRVFWGWVALDADTRRVLAMVVGDHDAFIAECLW